MATLEELRKQINAYSRGGFVADVVKASRQAREATRVYIMRTHPSTAFGGMDILHDENHKGTILKGLYEVTSAGVIDMNLYANYFARWYNTGAYGRTIRGDGPRKGERGPKYPSRGNYFTQNAKAIEEYYMNYMLDYLRKNIKL